MDRQTLRERLMATFLGELEEHVHTLTRDLLAIEQTPAQIPDRLASLFRSAHSLKGAARAVNLQPIETVCHHLESLLGAARDGKRRLDPDAVQRLFAAARALEDASARLHAGTPLTPGPLQDVLTQLAGGDAASDRQGESSSSRPRTPVQVSPAGAPAIVASPRDSAVRVPAETLDNLLSSSGELLVARRRTAAEHGEVAALHEQLRQSRGGWQRLAQPLKKLARTHGELLPRRAVAAIERTDAELKALERRFEQLTGRLQTSQRALDHAAASLEDQIRRARLLPFSEACEGLVLTLRDLTRAGGTPVDLVIEGGDTQLDRFVVASIRPPLLQLVRNAVAHGVETPLERQAAGKPPRGTVTVTATLRGDAVEITVLDDGRGLALDTIRALAREHGLAEPESDSQAVALIFRPGFSTAGRLTEVSGRGVGLDIVRHQVESLQGHVEILAPPTGGLQVVMQVPLTLTTVRALLVKAGGQTFALPVAAIRRVARVTAAAFVSAGGRDMLLTNDAPLPAASLVDLLGIDAPQPHDVRLPVVVMGAGRAQAAIVVQELLAEEEVLVKNLGPRLKRVAHVSGATILPSGQVALILNAAEVVQSALATSASVRLASADASRPVSPRRRLVLADDSVTTRTLERTILEAAGYEVLAAVDGAQAWELLQSAGADLVVADVEMPRMDGFALCEAIRASPHLRELPVVLVTALESESDRRRGLDAGADAYLPKSSFDQQLLLDAVSRLL